MCTGIYVGSKVSADGWRTIARSEDHEKLFHSKVYTVEPSVSEAGRFFTDIGSDRKEHKYPLPEHTFKYTRVPDAHPETEGQYGSTAMNEYGFMITGTMSLMNVPEEYHKLDPLMGQGDGIREAVIVDLLACQAKSCREALKLLAFYMDEVGAEEPGAVVLSDRAESWLFEFYGGHSYAGMRFSEDVMAVLGTLVMMEWVDLDADSEDYIFSGNLKGILDQMPKTVRDDAGRYHIARTIASDTPNPFFSRRIWRAHQLFAPSVTGDFNEKEFYSLCFKPDRPVSLKEIVFIYGDRFDGSPYDMKLKKNKNHFPVGDDYQCSISVVQQIPGLPDRCCYIHWLAMGNARYAVFVPSFSGITDTERHYQSDTIEKDTEEYSWYELGTRLWGLSKSDQKYLGDGVRSYQIKEAERMAEVIQDAFPEVIRKYHEGQKEGDEFVTALSGNIAKEAYERQCGLYKKLVYAQIRNLADYVKHKAFCPEPEQ